MLATLVAACSSTLYGAVGAEPADGGDGGPGSVSRPSNPSPDGSPETQTPEASTPDPTWVGFGTPTATDVGVSWAPSNDPAALLPKVESLPCPDGVANCTLHRLVAATGFPSFTSIAPVAEAANARGYASFDSSYSSTTHTIDVGSFDLTANRALWGVRFAATAGAEETLSRVEAVEGDGAVVFLVSHGKLQSGSAPLVVDAFYAADSAHPEAGLTRLARGAKDLTKLVTKRVSKDALVVETGDGEIVRLPINGPAASAFGPDRRVTLVSAANGVTALRGVASSKGTAVPAYTQSPSGAITPWLSDRIVPTTDGQSVAWIVDRNFVSYLDIAPFGAADSPSREVALTARSYSIYQMEMAHGRLVMADLDNAYLVDLASGGVRTAAVKLWAGLGDGAYPLRDSALFIDNGEIREVRF